MNKRRLEEKLTQLFALKASHQIESIRRDTEITAKIREVQLELDELYKKEHLPGEPVHLSEIIEGLRR